MLWLLTLIVINYIYEDSDSLIVIGDTLTMCGTHEYSVKAYIATNSRLLIRQWNNAIDSSGWLLLRAPLVVLRDSSSVDGSGAGYSGGDNIHPDGFGVGYGQAGGMSGGAGGGAGYGGNGGNGGGSPGFGGVVYGSTTDTLIDIGSGGGAGRIGGGVEGFGGNGGAEISLRAELLIVDSSAISTNGQNGHEAVVVAGGAGSGGGILMWADSLFIHHGYLESSGGYGGNASGYGGGGAGGGRIKLFYTSTCDTSNLSMVVQGGIGGTGEWGNGQPGMIGSLYLGHFTSVAENAHHTTAEYRMLANLTRIGVDFTLDKAPDSIMFYDVSGILRKSLYTSKKRVYVDLRDLSQGIYLVLNSNMELIGKVILVK